MENFTKKTLGELLSNEDETIKRNAISILKQLQRLSEQKPETQQEFQKKHETKWKNEPKHKTEWKNEPKHKADWTSKEKS